MKLVKSKRQTKKDNKKNKIDKTKKNGLDEILVSNINIEADSPDLSQIDSKYLDIIESLSNDSTIDIKNLNNLKDNISIIEDILIKRLCDFNSDKYNYVDSDNHNSYLFPLILLGEMRITKAFPLIVEMFSVDESYSYYLYDEFIKNDLSTILYRTYNGDNKLLESMILNKKIDIYCRIQALMVYLKLGSEGTIKWINLLNVVNKLTRNINKEDLEDDEVDIITHTAVFIAEFHIVSLIKVMRKIIRSSNFDQSVCGEYENYIDKMFTYESDNLVSNIILDYRFETRAYVNRMYNFENEHIIEKTEKPYVDDEKLARKKEMMESFLNACKFVKPEIQKNDLCYCGSGKKYKKCCIDEPNEKYVYKPLSQYYDLLIDYPQEDTIDGKKGLKSLFIDKAIEMDKWFYKAFHYVNIPNYIPQDIYSESLFKAGCILNGLDLALEIIEEEKISTEEEFNDKFMIHYDILSCSNAAYKMIHDNNYPVPQLNSRIDSMFYAINSKLK